VATLHKGDNDDDDIIIIIITIKEEPLISPSSEQLSPWFVFRKSLTQISVYSLFFYDFPRVSLSPVTQVTQNRPRPLPSTFPINY